MPKEHKKNILTQNICTKKHKKKYTASSTCKYCCLQEGNVLCEKICRPDVAPYRSSSHAINDGLTWRIDTRNIGYCSIRCLVCPFLFLFSFCIIPFNILALLLLLRSRPVVTQIPGRIAEPPSPAPLRYVPFFLSREEFNIFFPRRLPSNCTVFF